MGYYVGQNQSEKKTLDDQGSFLIFGGSGVRLTVVLSNPR
jgi:hypothetical protein